MRGDGLKAAWANYKPFAHTTHTNTHFSDSTKGGFCTRATKHAWQMPAWPSPAAISCQALPIACPPTIPGARSHGVALGGIHSTLWRIEAVVATHSLKLAYVCQMHHGSTCYSGSKAHGSQQSVRSATA